jgi:hypothetical protein
MGRTQNTARPFANKGGLSDEKVAKLLKGLEKLKDFDEELPNRLARYVLDGEDDGTLGELATKPDAASALELICTAEYSRYSLRDSWRDFLATIEPVDAGCYLRLGKVFEAAARGVPSERFFFDADFEHARWLELLLQQAEFAHAKSGWSSHAPKVAITGQLIEDMLRADGRTPDAFIRAAFVQPPNRWVSMPREFLLRVAELGKTFDRHRDLVAGFLTSGTAESRRLAVENLVRSGATPAVFVTELVACATDSSKKLREVAEAFLRSAASEARPHLERQAREGDRNQREHAVRLLGRLCGEAARPFLETLVGSEKSAPVHEVIDATLADLRGDTPAAQVESTALPPQEPIALEPPITPALRQVLERIFAEYNTQAEQHNELLANPPPNRYIHPPKKLPPLTSVDLDRTCDLLERGGKLQNHFAETLTAATLLWREAKGAYRQFLEHADTQLIHVVRLIVMTGLIHPANERGQGLEWPAVAQIDVFRRSHTPRITYQQVADALESAGIRADLLVHHALYSYWQFWNWEPEAVWPFFSNRLPALEKAFDPPSGDWTTRYLRRYAFLAAIRILAKFPQVPEPLVGRLWELSIGSDKSDRLAAQQVSAKLPDVQARLAKALTSGSYQTRAIAAEWLGRLGDRQAVGPLDAAARKEKQDAALDEILTALERLGEPIEPYLDRERLQSEAAKGLKNGIPEALAWFPWDALPVVHWQDTGERIAAEVLTWLLVQNVKLKSPEAGPLLRRYCALMVPSEREAFGESVLRAWLERDLRPKHTPAEARALAKQQAAQLHQVYQQSLQWYQQQGQAPPQSYLQNLSQLEEYQYQILIKSADSAVAEKGLLAVAGACCGDAAVLPVQKYLKEWYGYRAAQCKALIAMLSTIDRPSAIQYLLSIANRFRTKGIREEAEKYVRLLAERKNWTLDELADRTMSTAGFDDEGQLVLDFGPRQFTARVNTELEAILYDGDGKPLKALPAPRKDDNEELAKAAKKAFSAAKAELKQFAGLQKTRLYEAMCTQRTWPAADWKQYLLEHPLLRFLCQRLVWAVCDGDRVTATFRPLDDGTLTDAADEEVAVRDADRLRIAHECQVPADVAAAWNKHLADYDVMPLFSQFGRGVYTLPEVRQSATALDDFQGHMVEAFKLRGLATKFGYTRGPAEDGGWFYEYQKLFPGLGLEVHLGFSGNGLPEENRTVALTSLTFRQPRSRDEQYSPLGDGGGLSLNEIPAVLVAECYNDLRAIAATGTGFDPEWEQKAYN